MKFTCILKPGVEFHYENGFRNNQIVPRYKGINQTNQLSYLYKQFGNPIRSYEYLSVILFIFFKSCVEFHYENCFQNHQLAPRYKGIE